jgi:hypothetical protein
VALAIVLPAVACLAGYEYFMRGPMAQPPSASGQALCAQHAVSRGSPPSQGPAPAIAQPNQQAEGASGVSGVSAIIDRTLSTASQQALAESGLPQTAEQRATWARKEFPHVMDLYDLITADTSPVGVLATSIEPACVLVVPGPRAADMQASMQCTLAAPAAAPWDGTPACAPEWAEAMPGRSGWPCGWQALVVFSGEIFKLDCPESLAENNVKPTVEGVLAAARIAGWVVRDGAGSDRYAQPQPPAVTPEYVNRLASNLELVQSVVAYVAVSSELVETPEFMEVAGLARSLLRETYSSTSPCKRSAQTRQVLLNELFSRRRDALEALAGRISPGEVR